MLGVPRRVGSGFRHALFLCYQTIKTNISLSNKEKSSSNASIPNAIDEYFKV
jgi:hypothetical protein